MTDCSICALAYTANLRPSVPCPTCGFQACRQCWQKGISADTRCDADGNWAPSCMSCGTPTGSAFIFANLSSTFINSALRDKEHAHRLVIERLLLACPVVQAEGAVRRRRRTNQPRIREIAVLMDDMRSQLQIVSRLAGFLDSGGAEREFVQDEPLYSQIDRLRDRARRALRAKAHFLHRCAVHECVGCLDDQNRCQVCDAQTCPACLQPGGDAHECKTENVETAAEVRRSCRPCPNPGCGLPTQRSEGCPQMWCVACHRFWDWNTGQLCAAGSFQHNPEFFRWMDENPDAAHERAGAREAVAGVDLRGLRALLKNRHEMSPTDSPTGPGYRTWLSAGRLLNHLVGHALPSLRPPADPREENKDLAVARVAGDLSEEEWGKKIRGRCRARKRKSEEHRVLAALAGSVTGIVAALGRDPRRSDVLWQGLLAATGVANDQLRTASHSLRLATMRVNLADWQLDRVRN